MAFAAQTPARLADRKHDRGNVQEAQEIHGPDGGTLRFEIDPWKKHCLLNGLDDIALTLEKAPKIDMFESRLGADRPWA